jgi:hypothetical protein
MAPDAGVDKFVQDDIVGKVRRHDGQERIEPDAAGAGGTAPDSPLAADAQAAGAVAVFAGQSVQAPGEIRPGGAAVTRQSSLRSSRLKRAMLHYEIGVRIGELSPPAGFDGVLPSRTNSDSHAGLCPRSDVAQKDAERTKTSR